MKRFLLALLVCLAPLAGALAQSSGGCTISSACRVASLAVTGNATIGGSLTVSGTFSFGSLAVTNATVSGALNGWAVKLGVSPASNPAPAAPGSGYAVGDVLTLADGCATHATLAVVQVSAGALQLFNVTNPGSCGAAPANPVAVGSHTGAGTGATFNLTWNPAQTAGMSGGLALGNNGNYFAGGETPNPAFGGFESTFVGDRCGASLVGASSFNTCFGHDNLGVGSGGTFVGGGNAAGGVDNWRNWGGGSANTAWGNNIGQNQLLPITGQSGFGFDVFQNNNDPSTNSRSVGIGYLTCPGASIGTAAFSFVNCFGSAMGGKLTTAKDVLLIGGGEFLVGNAVFASGTGVIMMGSGKHTVDTPAAGTSDYINFENIYIATGTNTPTTSATQISGSLDAYQNSTFGTQGNTRAGVGVGDSFGGAATVFATGPTTNAPLFLTGKGNGNTCIINTTPFGTMFCAALSGEPSPSNFVQVQPAANGAAPILTVTGPSDTNIGLVIRPQGTGLLSMNGAAQWVANGAVATVFTGLGPPGAHTTIQNWFQVVDNGGNIRYLPAF